MEKARSIKVGGLLCLFPERQVHSARPMCTESFSFSLVWGCPSAKNKPGHRCAASLVNAQTKRQLRLFFSQKRDNCNGKKYGNLVKPFRNQVKCFRWPNLTSIKYHFFSKIFSTHKPNSPHFLSWLSATNSYACKHFQPSATFWPTLTLTRPYILHIKATFCLNIVPIVSNYNSFCTRSKHIIYRFSRKCV